MRSAHTLVQSTRFVCVWATLFGHWEGGKMGLPQLCWSQVCGGDCQGGALGMSGEHPAASRDMESRQGHTDQ